MKKILTILLCLGMTLMFTSCATILKGTTETIAIDSNVKGAKVFIDEAYVGETPYVGIIKKSNGAKTIRVSKEGYSESVATMNSTYELAAILSGFTGISCTTDLLTGAMWKYEPSTFYVNLTE